jgi:O-antigen biosynthesis protein
MKVGIVGIGELGIGLGTGLAELGHEVVCTDPDPAQVRRLEQDEIPLPGVASIRSLERTRRNGAFRVTREVWRAVHEAKCIFLTPSRATEKDALADLWQAVEAIGPYLESNQVVVINFRAPRGTNALVGERLALRTGVNVHVASSLWQTATSDRILENLAEVAIGVRRREPSLVLQELYYSFLPAGQICKVTRPGSVELPAEQICEVAKAESVQVPTGQTCEVIDSEGVEGAAGRICEVTEPRAIEVPAGQSREVKEPEAVEAPAPQIREVPEPEGVEVTGEQICNATEPEGVAVPSGQICGATEPESVEVPDSPEPCATHADPCQPQGSADADGYTSRSVTRAVRGCDLLTRRGRWSFDVSRRAIGIWRREGFRVLVRKTVEKLKRRAGWVTSSRSGIELSFRAPPPGAKGLDEAPSLENCVDDYEPGTANTKPASVEELAKQTEEAERVKHQLFVDIATPAPTPPPAQAPSFGDNGAAEIAEKEPAAVELEKQAEERERLSQQLLIRVATPQLDPPPAKAPPLETFVANTEPTPAEITKQVEQGEGLGHQPLISIATRVSNPSRAEAPPLESFVDNYAAWIAKTEPSLAELQKQAEEIKSLKHQPLISILTPVFGPPPAVLEATIESVLAQTYPRWELCLVDAGSANAEVGDVLRRYAVTDSRIRVKFLGENLGISANTNAALQLTHGDYIALLDHDDLLAPFALYEVARYLADHPRTDLVYSDEDKVDGDGRRHTPFFKPQWSPDLLDSFMYVGHLSVYRREVVQKIAGIPTGCDLSQDYDLALRISETARDIGHVAKVLYHWRVIQGSAAAGHKPYARASNLRALQQSVDRRRLDAQVMEYPTANRVRYNLPRPPLISIILPSDSEELIPRCIGALTEKTTYPNYEILVVTKSAIAKQFTHLVGRKPPVEFVPFDSPFNFSAKCNAGATRAAGQFLLFLNDDVEPREDCWLEAMAGWFQRPDIGAVGPKLLYADGTVQHAGLVTGVRGFVGTAFHTDPGDSFGHFNFIQSTRNTSALSAACLLMPKTLFDEIGGFDEVNTPIMHSDVDLCFRIREAGYRLVYTPFATLTHTGHASLCQADDPKGKSALADLFLLRRWGGFIAEDPYFTESMRNYLYRDSPTPFRLIARNRTGLEQTKGNLLAFSHDLGLSGAPLSLFWLVKWLWETGYFVTVYSPKPGPLAAEYEECGIPVIIDPLIRARPDQLKPFLGTFDVFLLNTILGAGLVHVARELNKPCLWFIHEAQYGKDLAAGDASIRSAMALADRVIFPAHASAALYRDYGSRNNHLIVRCGIPPLERPQAQSLLPRATDGKLQVVQVGAIEPRKGQDILLWALRHLPEDVARDLQIHFVGNITCTSHIPGFAASLFTVGTWSDSVFFHGELPPEEVKTFLQGIDVLVCSSRDEVLPITVRRRRVRGRNPRGHPNGEFRNPRPRGRQRGPGSGLDPAGAEPRPASLALIGGT